MKNLYFDESSYNSFEEAALEKYGESCKSGEKMTFGKCQKVGGSSKKEMPSSLTKSKANAEAQLASAKKMGNKPKIAKAERMLASVNKKMDAYNAGEETEEFKSGGCPDGFRSSGYKTIAGKRREVCCSPDGKTCITSDGLPV